VPIILAGDFNDWQGVRVLREAGCRRFSCSIVAGTRQLSGPLPVLPLDRIYVRGLRVVSAEVLHGRPWSRLSDHLPLTASCCRTSLLGCDVRYETSVFDD
jgi:endonuclease/exonuclease/phosphatase family metal-dependent hydrolase